MNKINNLLSYIGIESQNLCFYKCLTVNIHKKQ